MLLGWVSIFVGLILVISLYILNRSRAHRTPYYELTPNCLLTKHPILFLPGRQSLFYFSQYWNHIPQYLSDHGYQVYSLRLPWRSRTARHRALMNFLESAQSRNIKLHIIGDASSAPEIQSLAEQGSRAITSLHILGEPPLKGVTPYRHCIESHHFGVTPVQGGLQRCLALLHKGLILAQESQGFSAAEIGWTTPINWHNVAQRYLSWAIQLAERDFHKENS